DPPLALAVLLDEIAGAPQAAEAWLDLVLSEQPPDLRRGRLRYLLTPLSKQGHQPDDETRHCTAVVRLTAPAGKWIRPELRPAADAAEHELGGADNAMVAIRLGLRVRRGASLRLFVDDLTVVHRHAGNELHARQRALARKLA